MRAAETERYAKPLRRPDGDVGAPLSRRSQQRQRQQVGGRGDDGAAIVRCGHHSREVADRARRCRVGHEQPEQLAVGQTLGQVSRDDLDTEWLGASRENRQRVRMGVGVYDETWRGRLRGTST